MTDIVERLRKAADEPEVTDATYEDMEEAADEIERLRKENEILSAAVMNMLAKEVEHVKVYKSAVGI